MTATAGSRTVVVPADLLVIETDGTFEEPDTMKIAYDGAPATGLDVLSHTADELARLRRSPGIPGGTRPGELADHVDDKASRRSKTRRRPESTVRRDLRSPGAWVDSCRPGRLGPCADCHPPAR